MTEIVTLFRQFLYRDLAFILGGFIVLLSLAYAFRSCIRPIDWHYDWGKFPTAASMGCRDRRGRKAHQCD